MTVAGDHVPRLPIVVEGPSPLAHQPLDTPQRIRR
jgi:hypothetical protein